MVKGQIEERISKLKQNFKQPTDKVLTFTWYKIGWCKLEFVSKNYNHVLIQKVIFSTKKELLTQPYTRKSHMNT